MSNTSIRVSVSEDVHKNSRGVTLVELMVTLAIFGAVSAVLISSFITLFTIRGQSNVTQGAYDDVRVVFDNMERELQNAVGTLTPSNCSGSVCQELRFEVLSGDTKQTIAYRKTNPGNGIQKAIETLNSDPSNRDICKGIEPTGLIPVNCWQTITGGGVAIAVLDFTVEYPAGANVPQKSPLISIGLKGGATDAVGNSVALNFSTSINPRNKILVDQVVETNDPDAPLLTLVSFSASGGASCNGIWNDHPITGTPAGAAPASGGTYYTLCTSLTVQAQGTDDNGILYIQLSRDATLIARETETGGGTTLTRTFSNTPLTPFTSHIITVRTVDVSGNATERAFTIIQGAPPYAPTVTSTSQSGCGTSTGRVTVNWSTNPAAVNGFATSFQILMDGALVGTPVAGGARTASVGVWDGAIHNFQVRAINNLGFTDSSPAVAQMAPPSTCVPLVYFYVDGIQTNTTVTRDYGTSLSLRWDPVQNATADCPGTESAYGGGVWPVGLKSRGGGGPVSVRPTAGGVTTYTMTCTGIAGTTVRTATVNVRPLAPTNFQSGPGTCGVTSIRLSWTPQGGATGYNLRYKPATVNGWPSSNPEVRNWAPVPGGNVSVIVLTAGTAGTNYYFEIQATNGSLLSTGVLNTTGTFVNTPCAAPTGMCILGPEYAAESGSYDAGGGCMPVDDCQGFRPPYTPSCISTWVTGSVIPFPHPNISAWGTCFTRQVAGSSGFCTCTVYNRDCTPNTAPTANAGPDQSLAASTVSAPLSGSGTDAEGGTLTYAWSLDSGPAVTWSSTAVANPTVSGLTSGSTYVFRLRVTDVGNLFAEDTVQVVVSAVAACGTWVASRHRVNVGSCSGTLLPGDYNSTITAPCGPDGTTRTYWASTPLGCTQTTYTCECGGDTIACWNMTGLCESPTTEPADYPTDYYTSVTDVCNYGTGMIRYMSNEIGVWASSPEAASCPGAPSCINSGDPIPGFFWMCAGGASEYEPATDSQCCSGTAYAYCPNTWGEDSFTGYCGSITMPTATLNVNSNNITAGQSIALTWSSTDASSCTAGNTAGSAAWIGAKGTAGISSVTLNTAGTYTFTLQCTDGTRNSNIASRTVTVNPSVTTYTLTVSKAGAAAAAGTVSSAPAGISCGADCSEAYTSGTAVSLSGSISNGSVTYSGACSGSSCNLSMTAARSVTATFSCNSGYTWNGSACAVVTAAIACYQRDCGFGPLGGCDQSYQTSMTPIACGSCGSCCSLNTPLDIIYMGSASEYLCAGLNPAVPDWVQTCTVGCPATYPALTTKLTSYLGTLTQTSNFVVTVYNSTANYSAMGLTSAGVDSALLTQPNPTRCNSTVIGETSLIFWKKTSIFGIVTTGYRGYNCSL